MKLNELKELIELISEKNFTEFELEEEGVKLKVKKGGIAVNAVTNREDLPSQKTAVGSTMPVKSTSSEVKENEAGLQTVTAPMVGTFYRAPTPGSPPFVSEGDRVKVGQVLCIIEAMKLMNEIESESVGEIVEIFVENEKPVQYGDKLFSLRISK